MQSTENKRFSVIVRERSCGCFYPEREHLPLLALSFIAKLEVPYEAAVKLTGS